MGSVSCSSGGPLVVTVGLGVLVLVTVGVGDAFVGVGVGATVVGRVVVGATVVGATVVGATVVGATVVGAAVVGLGDLVRVAVGVGLGSGSLFELLRAAHNAPAPSPSRIARTTAMMIGFFEGLCSGCGSSGGPEGGICIVG